MFFVICFCCGCTFVYRILFMIHSVLSCFPFADYLQSLSSRLSQISPAFDPSRSENTSDACKRHTRQFIDALHRFELWAFQSNYKYTLCVMCSVFFLVCSFQMYRNTNNFKLHLNSCRRCN